MQRVALAIEFGRTLGQRYSVAVDITVHAPGAEGDQRNHYAHILTTTRQATLCQGQLVLGGKATLELSDRKRGELKLGRAREAIKSIRSHWAELANQHLAQAGHDVRIDHRTLKEQGIDRVPTVHLGPVATAMERRGKKSERGEINREIRQLEAGLLDLKAQQAANSGG